MADELKSDPFCGSCGSPCGVPCEDGCGAAMIGGRDEGAVLLVALHVPGAAVTDDADMVATELVEIINEERRRNGGSGGDVTVSVLWLTRPDGLVRCCLCFDRFPFDELNVTESGDVEDVCKPCAAYEAALVREDTTDG